jgi:hypothetical protein
MVDRALIPQPVHDAIGLWIYYATDLRPWRAESNLPRPALPYVGFEIKDLGAVTSPSDEDFESSIASAVLTITAPVDGYVVVVVNSARVEFKRTIETLDELAIKVSDRIGELAKGRAISSALIDVVTVLPVIPGDLLHVKVIEGATLVLDEEGPAYQVSQNVYRFTVSVQLHGLPYGSTGGTLGDGRDMQTALVALREALSKAPTKRRFADVWTRIIDAPGSPITVGSVSSSGQKETRGTLVLTIGVTIRTCSASQAASDEIELPGGFGLNVIEDQPLPLLVIE